MGLFGPILSLNRFIRGIWDWIWAIFGALSLDLGHFGGSWAYFRPFFLGCLGLPKRGNVDPQIPRWDLWAIRGLFWAILGLFWAILGHSGPILGLFMSILESLDLPRRGTVDPQIPRWALWAYFRRF